MSEEEESPSNLIDKTDADVVDPLAGLKPRQRRLAQLLAEGKSNSFIQEELGYSGSRVSILANNPLVRAEVARLQDKLFEEGIETRLKNMNESALNHVDFVLNDRTNRVKVTEKNDIAKWVIEMQKSKAPQVHDVGQNMLSVLLDRLDAKKTERRVEPLTSNQPPSDVIEVEVKQLNPAPATPKDDLSEWIEEFCGESK